MKWRIVQEILAFLLGVAAGGALRRPARPRAELPRDTAIEALRIGLGAHE